MFFILSNFKRIPLYIMIYLDNCSTTNKKPKAVLTAFIKGIKKYSVNPGRGSYNLSIKAGLKVLELRDLASSYFHNDSLENVIITKNCTEALNLILRGSAKENGHVIVSAFEHNSVFRTLTYLEKKYNLTFSIVYPKSKDGVIELDEIKQKVRPNTYLVFINHTSNVFGATQKLKEIGTFCKTNNLLFGVDTAQSAGHEPINMSEFNINYIAVAGHKGLMGSQGIGLAIVNNAKLKPLIMGGTGTESESIIQPSDSPEGLESGTLNVPAILSFIEGIKFVNKKQNQINKKICNLTNYLITELKEIPSLQIYYSNIQSGVVSFRFKDRDTNDISSILDKKFSIAVRSGLHCAPICHKFLGTFETGLVRVGIGYYNTKRDIKTLIQALWLISTNYY